MCWFVSIGRVLKGFGVYDATVMVSNGFGLESAIVGGDCELVRC